MRALLAGLLALSGGGCAPQPRCPDVDALPPAKVVALGDSILAWNAGSCESVTDHLSRSLGARVTRAAVSGARLRGGEAAIPRQLPAGSPDRWHVAVVTGGVNDLRHEGLCDSDDLSSALDRLATADGAGGSMAALTDRLLARGLEVVLLATYDLPETARYGFAPCREELRALAARYRAVAGVRPGVTFIDLADVVARDHVHLAPDHVHPSPRGAERLGTVIARAVPSP